MTSALLCIAIALSLAVLAVPAVLALRGRRRSGIGQHLRQSIVINRTDGNSIKGVLLAEHRDCYQLTHAEFLGGGEEVLLAGEILIPRSKVAFVQIMPAEAGGE